MYSPRHQQLSRAASVNSLQAIVMQIIVEKGEKGFGFTVADSPQGQRVKHILDKQGCNDLLENDLILEIDGTPVQNMPHNNVVEILKDYNQGDSAIIVIQRQRNTSVSPVQYPPSGGNMRYHPPPITQSYMHLPNPQLTLLQHPKMRRHTKRNQGHMEKKAKMLKSIRLDISDIMREEKEKISKHKELSHRVLSSSRELTKTIQTQITTKQEHHQRLNIEEEKLNKKINEAIEQEEQKKRAYQDQIQKLEESHKRRSLDGSIKRFLTKATKLKLTSNGDNDNIIKGVIMTSPVLKSFRFDLTTTNRSKTREALWDLID